MKRGPLRVGIAFNASGAGLPGRSEDDLGVEDARRAVEAIERSLAELGHAVERLPLSDDVGDFLRRLRRITPDVVVNLCETFRGESLPQANVAALLDRVGIPYTGATAGALALSTDKALAKALLADAGLRVPAGTVVHAERGALAPSLRFPLIVKPLYEDGSYGIWQRSVVDSEPELCRQISEVVDRFRQPALVEEYVAGREINIALIGNDPPEVLPLGELDYSAYPETLHRICTFEAKWSEETFEYRASVPVCPAPLAPDVRDELAALACRAFRALGCRDYARCDVRLDAADQPVFIEVNANPSIVPGAGYVRSLLASGRTYTAFVELLLRWSLARRGA